MNLRPKYPTIRTNTGDWNDCFLMRTTVLFTLLFVLAVLIACRNRKDETAPAKSIPPCVIVTNKTETAPALTNQQPDLVATNKPLVSKSPLIRRSSKSILKKSSARKLDDSKARKIKN